MDTTNGKNFAFRNYVGLFPISVLKVRVTSQ